MIALCATADVDAGGGCFRCNTVGHHKVAVVQQKVVNVVPAAITFVPSQVLLNSQVTLYNPSTTGSGLGYSYQGAAVTQQQATQPSALETRIGNLEQKVDRILQHLGGDDDVAVATANTQWQTVLKNSCVSCHGAEPSGEGNSLALLDADGTFKERLPRFEIYRRMTLPVNEKGHMPKGGGMVPLSEQEKVRAWVNEGLKGLDY
jgi:mono/diheme cytochrome c family protein